MYLQVVGNWQEYAVMVATFLLGILVTSGRPMPTLIKLIQVLKGWLNKILPGSNWGAILKWVFAGLLTAAFAWINGDLSFSELTPAVLLGLFYLFQSYMSAWYEKLKESGALR